MNTEQTKELINRAKELANTEELKSLITDLEGFINIQLDNNTNEMSEEVKKRWVESREKLWASFEKITALYGISPEMIRAHLENPSHFSPEHQETLELLKQGNTEKPMKKSPIKTLKTRA